MALENKVLPENRFGKFSYIDAAGLQALIDKIAALRKSLVDADAAAIADATQKINDLSTELKELIQDNTDKDNARETRLETVENKVKTIETVTVPALEQADKDLGDRVEVNETNITNLQTTKADKTELKDWVLTSDFNAFKTSVEADLNKIVAALENIVSAAAVGTAYDEAVAATETPAQPGA